MNFDAEGRVCKRVKGEDGRMKWVPDPNNALFAQNGGAGMVPLTQQPPIQPQMQFPPPAQHGPNAQHAADWTNFHA